MEDAFLRSIAFTTAVFPAIVVVVYFLVGSRVSFNADLIWAGFGLGAGAALPAVAIATLYESVVGFGDGFYEIAVNRAFFGAALPEEVFKFAALLTLCWRQIRDIQPNHLFALSVVLACGFACFENIFYVVESGNWRATAIMRSISAVPGHAFVGAVMGWCIIRATHSSIGAVWWAAALILPIALHGAYDFFIFAHGNIETRGADAPGDLMPFFTSMFILTVIFEGVVAHMSLRAVLSLTKSGEEDVPNTVLTPAWVLRVQDIGTRSFLWGVLGGLCILASGSYILVDHFGVATGFSRPEGLPQSLGYGFSVFAALHGLAFIGLSTVLRARLRSLVCEQPN